MQNGGAAHSDADGGGATSLLDMCYQTIVLLNGEYEGKRLSPYIINICKNGLTREAFLAALKLREEQVVSLTRESTMCIVKPEHHSKSSKCKMYETTHRNPSTGRPDNWAEVELKGVGKTELEELLVRVQRDLNWHPGVAAWPKS